jgi:hypothetical protein
MSKEYKFKPIIKATKKNLLPVRGVTKGEVSFEMDLAGQGSSGTPFWAQHPNRINYECDMTAFGVELGRMRITKAVAGEEIKEGDNAGLIPVTYTFEKV